MLQDLASEICIARLSDVKGSNCRSLAESLPKGDFDRHC